MLVFILKRIILILVLLSVFNSLEAACEDSKIYKSNGKSLLKWIENLKKGVPIYKDNEKLKIKLPKKDVIIRVAYEF